MRQHFSDSVSDSARLLRICKEEGSDNDKPKDLQPEPESKESKESKDSAGQRHAKTVYLPSCLRLEEASSNLKDSVKTVEDVL